MSRFMSYPVKTTIKRRWKNVGFKVFKNLLFPWNLLYWIFDIFVLCDYSSNRDIFFIFFIWCNILFTFMFHDFFYIISLKSIDFILFKKNLSFMFDNLNIVNLTLRHICLHCITLKTKNGNKWCFENLYCVSSKFTRCLICMSVMIFIHLFVILEIPISKGNKLGNRHNNKIGLLCSLIILDWRLLKFYTTFFICSC
jgi:hypothetical protein